jgi:hypothetical protein
MENESILGNERKLLVLQTVKASFFYIWWQRRSLILPLIVLVLAQLLTSIFLFWLLVSGIAAKFPGGIGRLGFCAWIPMWILQLSFMVGLQRRLHLSRPDRGLRVFVFDHNLLRSILTVAKVLLCVNLVPAVMAAVVLAISVMLFHPRRIVLVIALILLAWLIIFMILMMRLILAVPAAALGNRNCLSLSWHAMKGNSLRLFCAGILINGPFVIVGCLLAWRRLENAAKFSPITPVALDFTGIGSLMSWLAGAALGTIGVITTIVMLCIAYGSLARDSTSGTSPTAPHPEF